MSTWGELGREGVGKGGREGGIGEGGGNWEGKRELGRDEGVWKGRGGS